MIKAQYHFRLSPEGLLAWDIRRLVKLSAGLQVLSIVVSDTAELDENHWCAYEAQTPACRSIIE